MRIRVIHKLYENVLALKYSVQIKNLVYFYKWRCFSAGENRLRVEALPRVRQAGDNVVLRCLNRNSPCQLPCHWSFNGNPLPQNERFVDFLLVISHTRYTLNRSDEQREFRFRFAASNSGELLMSAVSASDDGEYSCQLNNSAHQVIIRATLHTAAAPPSSKTSECAI